MQKFKLKVSHQRTQSQKVKPLPEKQQSFKDRPTKKEAKALRKEAAAKKMPRDKTQP